MKIWFIKEPDTYLEISWTSMMERVVDVWLGSKYASEDLQNIEKQWNKRMGRVTHWDSMSTLGWYVPF